MRVETKKIYTFEEGDVVVDRNYNRAAIRHRLGGWKQTGSELEVSDSDIEGWLTSGNWTYFGNRHDKT